MYPDDIRISTELWNIHEGEITSLKLQLHNDLVKEVEYKQRQELLTFLKLFKKSMILDFVYEEKDGRWALFIHISNGVIQITGDKKHPLKDTVYLSPIIDLVSE